MISELTPKRWPPFILEALQSVDISYVHKLTCGMPLCLPFYLSPSTACQAAWRDSLAVRGHRSWSLNLLSTLHTIFRDMLHSFKNTQNLIFVTFAYLSQTCLVLFQSWLISKTTGSSGMSQKSLCLGTGDDTHSEWTRTNSTWAPWMNEVEGGMRQSGEAQL